MNLRQKFVSFQGTKSVSIYVLILQERFQCVPLVLCLLANLSITERCFCFEINLSLSY